MRACVGGWVGGWVCMHACMHVGMHACMHACMYVHFRTSSEKVDSAPPGSHVALLRLSDACRNRDDGLEHGGQVGAPALRDPQKIFEVPGGWPPFTGRFFCQILVSPKSCAVLSVSTPSAVGLRPLNGGPGLSSLDKRLLWGLGRGGASA